MAWDIPFSPWRKPSHVLLSSKAGFLRSTPSARRNFSSTYLINSHTWWMGAPDWDHVPGGTRVCPSLRWSVSESLGMWIWWCWFPALWQGSAIGYHWSYEGVNLEDSCTHWYFAQQVPDGNQVIESVVGNSTIAGNNDFKIIPCTSNGNCNYLSRACATICWPGSQSP